MKAGPTLGGISGGGVVMNDIVNDYSKFLVVYINDVLIYSKTSGQHFKHPEIFNVIKRNDLAVSALKNEIISD